MAGSAAAQAPPPAPLIETVDVEVVEVQVFVTDGAGSPARGLTAADFRLRVDGEERPIGNFYAADGGAEAAAAPAESPAVPAPPREAAAPPSPPPGQRLSLVVLLDELHLDPRQRGRTLSRLEPMLRERIDAGDSLLVAGFDRSLRVVHPFDSPRDLGESLGALRKRAPGGVQTEIERRQTISHIRALHASFGCGAMAEMRALADGWTGTVEHETRLTLAMVRDLVASLAGREGRKALLLVSSGLPLDPGLEARLLLDELCRAGLGGAQTGLAAEVHGVVRAANAAGVTFYTFDAGGQRVLVSAAEVGGAGEAASQFQVRANLQDPAFAIALDTGGRALVESNRPERLLADLARDLSSYYSLGFAPRPEDAGRSHRLEVEVLRPGLRVRHRASWQPMTSDERVGAALLGDLLLGDATDGGAGARGARLEIDPPELAAKGVWATRLRLTIPSEGLALLPDGERRRGRLRVFVAVGNDKGGVTPVRSLPLPVDLPLAGAPAVPLVIEVRLAAGENRIAVAVRDELSQQTMMLRRIVRAGPPR